MKRTFLILLTFLLIQNLYSQTDKCDCNDFFKNDLKNEFNSFSSQKAKEILYKYFTSDQTTRQKMKNDSSMEGSLGLVIETIPIDIGFSSSSSSNNSKYQSIYTQAIENKYISDELLQTIYYSALPDRAFTSYERCLDLCKEVYNQSGITLRNISTQNDLIVLEMRFRSTPSGGKISIKDAIYSTGTVIGRKKFKTNSMIVDGQVLYEHIKIKPEENITISITFNEGVNPASLSLESRNKTKKKSDAPLGTIVASLLVYNDFLRLNGLDYESDINKVIWVPCDGRNIGIEEETYGAYSGGKAPDLRGLFLRSVNDMGAYNATVPTPNNSNLNPENKKAGQIQPDAIKNHSHTISYQSSQKHSHTDGGSNFHAYSQQHSNGNGNKTTNGTNGGQQETRPKNISVYYYIKIR